MQKRGYWMPDEAASVYAGAHAVLSFECHSPIIATANGTPAPIRHVSYLNINSDIAYMFDKALDTWRNKFISWLEINWLQKDGAHDMDHLHRVWRNCRKLNAGEGDKADLLILLTAAYFHDLVTLPKNHPDRSGASLQSADKITELLPGLFDFPPEKIEGVHHAIHAHSFSANINTQTIEAKILQDADRIEALGATGVARLFYIAGKMDTSLYHSDDPLGKNRELDDKKYALDHIELKLLTLPDTMKTTSGKELAKKEAAYIVSFRQKLLEEI